MRVAVTAQGQETSSPLDLSFGRAKWLILVDTKTGQYETHDNAVNLNAPSGAGIQTAQNIANLGAEAVITGNVGPNAYKTLNAAEIKVFLAPAGSVKEALAAWAEGKLQEVTSANVEGHWV